LVTVRAPASTSNLGPGFDCLGAALTIWIEVELGGGSPLPDLIARAVAAVAGGDAVEGSVNSDIPRGRGLGSSGACVAAGLLAGCAIAGKGPDPDELLALGTPLEGHPDNLAAALYGGLTIVGPDGRVLRIDPAASVRPLILLPREELPTKQARRVLPETVPLADAVSNIAGASTLVAVLSGAVEATKEVLLRATGDLIHQPYRRDLAPRTAELVAALRSEGIAAAVSGAGPSVVCLVLRGEEGEVRAHAGTGWELLEPDWDLEGARILST
jgi:homoserine kinase